MRCYLKLFVLFSFLFLTTSNLRSQSSEYVSLPSPLQIVLIFQSPDLNYDSTLLVNTKEFKSYETKYHQLLIFGLLLSDMAYAIQNDEFKDARRILRILKQIGDENGMNEKFNRINLYNRFEENINSKDSMMTILLDASFLFESKISDEKLMKELSILFAGIWLEGAYISSQLASFQNKESLNKLIVHQYPILVNLITVFKQLPNEDAFHGKFTRELWELEDMMSKMKTIKKFMKKKNDLPLTDSELKLIEEKIRMIRNKVVEIKY